MNANVSRMNAGSKTLSRDWIYVGLLFVLTLMAFSRVVTCDFVELDDAGYVTENGRVVAGLTASNAAWAFTHTFSNWIPLDTLSHMLDCTLFGLNPAGHHAMNLAFHTGSVILLFLVLRRTLGAAGPAAFGAALWAVHPYNVEPVAWISSRKDVLSAFLTLAALLVYLRYARTPSLRWYLLVFLLFAAALLAKPMALTFPLLMLLLDLWPLDRMRLNRPATWKRPLLEKIPLLMLSVAIAGITYAAQQATQSVMPADLYPLGVRLMNGAVAAVIYLRKLAWPAQFAVFYPHPGDAIDRVTVIASAALLLAITAGAVYQFIRRQDTAAFALGWFWYLIALFPVSGVAFQLGGSSMADRYMYFAMVGFAFTVAWAACVMATRWPAVKTAGAVAAAVLCIILAVISFVQTGHWQDTEKLYLHTLAVTGPDNVQAQNGLAGFYLKQNRLDLAEKHLNEAGRLYPDFYLTRNYRGLMLAMGGDLERAQEQFRRAIELKPDYLSAQLNLAKCLIEKGRPQDLAEAREILRQAEQRIDPFDPRRQYVNIMLNHIDGTAASQN